MARFLNVGTDALWILLGVAVFLGAATAYRGVALLRAPSDEGARRRWRSVWTWWGLFILLLAMLISGRVAVVLIMAGVSLLVLREGLRLAAQDRLFPLLAAVALAVYGWAWLDWRIFFLRAVPLLIVAVLAAEIVWRARIGPRFGETRAVALTVLLAVVGPSFVVAVASLPASETGAGTHLGWLILLLILTELNDIAQGWWGRLLGARALAPILSPEKTWEGLWGGVATTTVAAVALGPVFTNYGAAEPPGLALPVPRWMWAAALGLTVGFAGTAGDLLASALKRRAGVKDSGSLLPGHGGVLDRFDSLALTSPPFFVLTLLLWF